MVCSILIRKSKRKVVFQNAAHEIGLVFFCKSREHFFSKFFVIFFSKENCFLRVFPVFCLFQTFCSRLIKTTVSDSCLFFCRCICIYRCIYRRDHIHFHPCITHFCLFKRNYTCIAVSCIHICFCTLLTVHSHNMKASKTCCKRNASLFICFGFCHRRKLGVVKHLKVYFCSGNRIFVSVHNLNLDFLYSRISFQLVKDSYHSLTVDIFLFKSSCIKTSGVHHHGT